MARAWIGLGSNLAQPEQQILQALEELNQLPLSQCVKTSSLWVSPPLGPQDQPDFINAAALIETQLSPLELLDQLQALETAHQRVRLQTWGPRTLDLDLLLYDQEKLNLPRLQVPHPQMHLRIFVLEPLLELDSELELPEHGRIDLLLKELRQIAPIRKLLPQEADPLSNL
ncbi:2-amino-4-hydroxy-6-hydroxymethyldihydropteridine diphosphokinase [Marinospirillum perlucidum]|uniref:2-amino-4-hydroxy-6- hydroxymethyldihydropteridine diphosphokinase n=1 Tax=Marinospirillum perlucidum TaxID=1982602 RepID=UPI000DF483F1|nr:2-amino-4-hydroxy-6-hydroxymethyldihydropteridine diphosphokinase [Marinospirillum perlucidum]